MINGLKILAIIPARGGSKGIKNKNISTLGNKPLISYTIEAALTSHYIDEILVSTDSQEIAKVCEDYGDFIPFLRPAALAGDNSQIIDAVLYTLAQLRQQGREYDALVLLQPTQPFRTGADIDAALEVYAAQGQKSLASVCMMNESPILMRRIVNGHLERLLPQASTVRRQDMPNYYKVNGCIYINNISELEENTSFNDNEIPFIMERAVSLDIDTAEDLNNAEKFLAKQKN